MDSKLVKLLEDKEKEYIQRIEKIDQMRKEMSPMNPNYYIILSDRRHWENCLKSMRARIRLARNSAKRLDNPNVQILTNY